MYDNLAPHGSLFYLQQFPEATIDTLWPDPTVTRYRGRGQSSCATFATPTQSRKGWIGCPDGDQTGVRISYMDPVMGPLPRAKRIRTWSGKQTVMHIPAPIHWWASWGRADPFYLSVSQTITELRSREQVPEFSPATSASTGDYYQTLAHEVKLGPKPLRRQVVVEVTIPGRSL